MVPWVLRSRGARMVRDSAIDRARRPTDEIVSDLRPVERPDGGRLGVARRFPFFPAWRLRGLRLVASDAAWERGDGLELRGPVESLLLVSTGRPAGLAGLDGPGLELAVSRLGMSARP